MKFFHQFKTNTVSRFVFDIVPQGRDRTFEREGAEGPESDPTPDLTQERESLKKELPDPPPPPPPPPMTPPPSFGPPPTKVPPPMAPTLPIGPEMDMDPELKLIFDQLVEDLIKDHDSGKFLKRFTEEANRYLAKEESLDPPPPPKQPETPPKSPPPLGTPPVPKERLINRTRSEAQDKYLEAQKILRDRLTAAGVLAEGLEAYSDPFYSNVVDSYRTLKASLEDIEEIEEIFNEIAETAETDVELYHANQSTYIDRINTIKTRIDEYEDSQSPTRIEQIIAPPPPPPPPPPQFAF